MLNLKDLPALFPPRCRAIFSHFAGWLGRDEAYLLILRWLLARWRRRAGEGLFNLKDLLSVFPPWLKGVLENEVVLRRLFATKSYQILPFSTKNMQRTGSNMAQNGGRCRDNEQARSGFRDSGFAERLSEPNLPLRTPSAEYRTPLARCRARGEPQKVANSHRNHAVPRRSTRTSWPGAW